MCIQAMWGGQMMYHHCWGSSSGSLLYTVSCDTPTLSERWAPNVRLADWLGSNITHTHQNNFLLPKYGRMRSRGMQTNVLQKTRIVFFHLAVWNQGNKSQTEILDIFVVHDKTKILRLYGWTANCSTADSESCKKVEEKRGTANVSIIKRNCGRSCSFNRWVHYYIHQQLCLPVGCVE